MKKTLFLIVLTGFVSVYPLTAGVPGDVLLGTWVTDEGKALVSIQKCGETIYCGTIIWLKEPTHPDGSVKRDDENPDATRRDRRILGLEILSGFKYGGNSVWTGGKIYDPENGKTYSCKMTLKGNKLKVRGYIGFSLLGRTTTWERSQTP